MVLCYLSVHSTKVSAGVLFQIFINPIECIRPLAGLTCSFAKNYEEISGLFSSSESNSTIKEYLRYMSYICHQIYRSGIYPRDTIRD